MRATIPFAAAAVAVALVGCSGGTPEPGGAPEPAVPDEQSCQVGTWSLDVADYQARSNDYLTGLGIPLEEFMMTGGGSISFTADGLVATEIDLLSTGILVAGDQRIPFSQPSTYTGSGDWAPGGDPDTIDLTNWANVSNDGTSLDPDAPAAPAIDFTDIPAVSALCTDDVLTLQGPDAPLSTRWTR